MLMGNHSTQSSPTLTVLTICTQPLKCLRLLPLFPSPSISRLVHCTFIGLTTGLELSVAGLQLRPRGDYIKERNKKFLSPLSTFYKYYKLILRFFQISFFIKFLKCYFVFKIVGMLIFPKNKLNSRI